ncbi:MAG: gliding motility-associated ABC transporter substrate-binding protein GldG [Cyclobacteriaceae bacterium]|nr:gliding motility-associated ABC transporter substrate-binding protein GldG [Cyclobacteriaceae bacterium]
MVNWKSKKTGDLLLFANGLVFVMLVNLLSSLFFFRLDLTEEKRYSIKKPTQDILNQLDDDVYMEVYLDGELNAPFRRFQKSIRETLEEFRIYTNNKIHYTFIDPSLAKSQKAQSEFMSELASKGIQPTNVIGNKDGQRIEKIVFPGVLISYSGLESGVMLLKGSSASSSEEKINQSIEGIEFELANALYKMVNTDPKRIGLLTGHGELSNLEVAAFTSALAEVYDVAPVSLQDDHLDRFAALLIAKPKTTFSPLDKYQLDQFIMRGGRVMFLLDKLDASMDSASREDYFAFPYNLGLDDLLYKYGVRINVDLIQDRNSAMYPVITGEVGGKPQMQLMPWPYFPLINRYADHPITRNLDAVTTKFVSSIDSVKAPGIKKTPLLFTSEVSRTLVAPVKVSINELRRTVKESDFASPFIPVGYLLEGKFSSLFKNRFLPEGAASSTFREAGVDSKIIVFADGDLAANVVNPRSGQPQAMGFDPFVKYTFANKDLLMNAVAYLTEDNGLIHTRNKEVKIRPLNKQKLTDERFIWQVVNLALPIIALIAFGVIRSILRNRRFAKF